MKENTQIIWVSGRLKRENRGDSYTLEAIEMFEAFKKFLNLYKKFMISF
jgi:hypothetical protein